jgi:uncharacterized membrane protein
MNQSTVLPGGGVVESSSGAAAAAAVPYPAPGAAIAGTSVATARSRIASIDVMRGLVMVLMLVDHVREKIYLHLQVSDPMNVTTTTPDLFFTRLSAHLCAPTFVFLTGLGAWLYANPANGAARSPSGFLIKRGLLLIAIELTLVNFSWSGTYTTLWLQVLWAIGISMIVLGLLAGLPRWVLAALGFVIVFSHNLLSPITFQMGEPGYALWTILHDRNFLVAEGPLKVKVTYPVLPWIGVILLGYTAGPLYSRMVSSSQRVRILIGLGVGCLALLLVLRGFNIYGETLPWVQGETPVRTVMSWLNFTKYPPSLDFLLLTLGLAFLLMARFETLDNALTRALVVFGQAPMFFYILHLYVLLVLYRIALRIFGPNQGETFGVDQVWGVWIVALVLAAVLYFPTRAFARYKRVSKQAWVRYF